MQEEWSIHTTNPIDVRIGLQIVLIEVYLIGFFFGIRSAFKGRIRSNLATIRDQSRLNWIANESRMWGDHKELRILLKNRLIPSRFNQELLYKGGKTPFYRKFPAINVGLLIRRRRSDGCDFAKSVGHDPMSPPFLPVRSSSTCQGESMCRPTINRVID